MTPEDRQIIQIAKVSDTVLSATQTMIKYLEGHTSKTEVVNQLESIHTPDVKYVVEALQVLDATLKTHENTDLSGVTDLMHQLLAEARLIPKEHPEPQVIDYTPRLTDLTTGLKTLEKAVKAQKLVAEAPVVNVPETKVHVAAPDLKPLETASKSLEKTIKVGQAEMQQVSSKMASGLITEAFDEYKVIWSGKFDDDEEDVVGGMKYFLNGKKVAETKYSYDKEHRLAGVKKL